MFGTVLLVLFQVLLVPLAVVIVLVLASLSPRAVAWLVTRSLNLALKKVPAVRSIAVAEIRLWRRKPVVSNVSLRLRANGNELAVNLAAVELTGVFKVVRNVLFLSLIHI